MSTAATPAPTAARGISGSTRVFLILGDPVVQVRAPEVFNFLFGRQGIDAVLVPAQVAPADFEGFVRQAFKARNIDGLWLAIPHKTAMVGLLDRCDRLGRVSGAVNAARRNADGSIEGALFDGLGFTKALDVAGVPIAGARALVVGVGGGGVAIAASLAARGVARLALFDAAPGRAESAAQRVRAEFGTDAVAAVRPDPTGFDLVVNATPLGLKADDPLPFDVEHLAPAAVVVDILMKNQPTPLLRACQARGVRAYPGFEMLLQQMPEYLAFFGYDDLARAVQADPSELRALLAPR
ncbi:MAG: shikimate dehydrogenase [Burkholderiales bacterium]|nr:shikimate dehydrogenase [Burkholderiales bacterium]MDE2276592.1 shikimate dehydrogenase [Burkholderiales bacterium]